jgi:putative ABC transport system permease protein
MSSFVQDLRRALRVFRKMPGFTLAALIVLALGIGANTSIFSLVYGVLIRPLPFAEPDRLVQLWHVPPAKSFPGMTIFPLSAANYLDWEQQNSVFESSAIYAFTRFPSTATKIPSYSGGRV